MPTLRNRLILALVALTLVGGACADESAEADAAKAEKIVPIEASAVPASLLGLNLAPEPSIVDNVKETSDSYVEAVGMFSMRKGEILQATLQVSRFTEESKSERSSFRRSIIQQIGSTIPQEYRMGDQPLFLTTGKQQKIAVWFKDRHMYILTTRADYPTPRTLLREAIKEVGA